MFVVQIHHAMRSALSEFEGLIVYCEVAIDHRTCSSAAVGGLARAHSGLTAQRDALEERCEAMFGAHALDPSCFCHMPGECPACLHVEGCSGHVEELLGGELSDLEAMHAARRADPRFCDGCSERLHGRVQCVVCGWDHDFGTRHGAACQLDQSVPF